MPKPSASFLETQAYIRANSNKLRSDFAILYEGSAGGIGVYKTAVQKVAKYATDLGIEKKDVSKLQIITDVLCKIPAPTFSGRPAVKFKNLSDCLFELPRKGLVSKAEDRALWSLASAAFAKNSKVVAIVRGSSVKPGSILKEVEAYQLARNKLSKGMRDAAYDILMDAEAKSDDLKPIDASLAKKRTRAEKSLASIGWKLGLDFK